MRLNVILPCFSSDDGNSSFFSTVGAGEDDVADSDFDDVEAGAGGLSDFAPASARPKRLLPPALNLGRESLPFGPGLGAEGRVSVSVETGAEVEDAEVVKPDIREAKEATGVSCSEVDWGASD
jgi:hypothetical protein